ncbi:hydrolase [Labrys miyagiensis]|uniref:Hydrolase n=1 Tax=Labrys miyagiensis TaxID=346912 RepID=A0ABQ6CY27_9HYPH|nr:hydrolase [Labrys miyagiensis]
MKTLWKVCISVKPVALFDLDGTLVNADHLHYEAWKHMLSPHGIDLTEESYRTDVMGSPNSLLLKSLLKGLDEKAGLALIDDKEAMFRRLFVKIEPAKGLTAFLDWLSGHGVPVGVVTNAPRANAEHQLHGLGLVKRFPLVVIGAEVARPKPFPDPYQVGLERLGGRAAASLAFEDSRSGIAAGKAAGLSVVGLMTGMSEAAMLAEGVDLAIPDYEDPRLLPFAAKRLGLA